ncbi:MAG: AAA family ATPase, partial [Clostridiales Family XIII bacterium]|nr:AAA family ATPase [Clostridiales Family XIII bacterium]
MEDLAVWKNRADRKPLILRGARQTGKTWLLEHHAGEHYDSSVRIAFDKNKQARRIFEPDLEPSRIIREIEDYTEQKIDPSGTLILL